MSHCFHKTEIREPLEGRQRQKTGVSEKSGLKPHKKYLASKCNYVRNLLGKILFLPSEIVA
jgi:hypothetical protein